VAEQITLTEVKQYCGIDSDFILDDALLTRLITASRVHFETLYGISIIPKTLQQYSDSYTVELLQGPVGTITAVTDSDGNDVEYTEKGLNYPTIYPSSKPVTVTYTAGFADGTLPEDLKQSILMKVRSLYDRDPALGKEAEDLSYRYCRNLFI
jgi:hypothetical protein